MTGTILWLQHSRSHVKGELSRVMRHFFGEVQNHLKIEGNLKIILS